MVLILSVIVLLLDSMLVNGSAPRCASATKNECTTPHHSSIAITAAQTVSNVTAATDPTYNHLIPHAFPPLLGVELISTLLGKVLLG